MNPVIRELTDALTAAGWSLQQEPPLRSLDSVLTCSYAAVGLWFVPDAKTAIRNWIVAQAEFAELRPSLGRDRDLYLLICVNHIEADAMNELPSVIGDTHVCRKILLEIRNRRPKDALDDVPLLFWSGPNGDAPDRRDIPGDDSHLPPRLLDDLGRRSAARILDAILAGDYGVLGKHAD